MKTVRRYVAPFRQALAAPEPGPAVPKTRQITRWLLTRPDRLRPQEQEQLGQITERCPHIQALAGYVTSFAEMMTGRTGSQDLEAWLTAIQADDGQPDLRSLATGIRNDQQAVINGLTLPWSSGKVEGTASKIKMIKRQMYGRAGFGLLRKRVILHPALPGPQNSRKSQKNGVASSRWAPTTSAVIARPATAFFSSLTKMKSQASRSGSTSISSWLYRASRAGTIASAKLAVGLACRA